MSDFFVQKPWFDGTAPVNAKKASVTIGEGEDGSITIEYDNVGTEGNSFTISAVVSEEEDGDLSVSLDGNDIIITLGTDVSIEADATKNTVELIANAIS